MQDYQGNSKKDKEPKPAKNVEKVVVGEVTVVKKSLGRKFKDIFIAADPKNTLRFVAAEVLLPAARNMVVDASTKGIERMMYGDSAVRRRDYGSSGTRYSYNNPINRGPRETIHPRSADRPARSNRRAVDDLILASREDAEGVVERMNDIIDNYDAVSVADLNELIGEPISHVDNKWGWTRLGNVRIQQIREGYLLDLPPVEAL